MKGAGLEQTMSRLTPAFCDQQRAAGLWTDELVDGFVTRAADQDAAALAMVDRGRRVSYGQLEQLIVRFAACLRAHGLEDRDVVSFQLPNWVEASIVHHGVLRAGGISNPIVPIYREREVEFILRQAESRVAIVPESFRGFSYRAMYEELCGRVPGMEQLWTVAGADGAWDEMMAEPWEDGAGGDAVRALQRSADEPALLLYTSGTTADPKGVIHTHNTLTYENRSIIDLVGLGPDDVVFMASPVTHITGVLYGLQLPPMLGGPVIFQDVWDPEQALRHIADEAVSFTVGATPFLHGLTYHDSLAEYDVSSMRAFACGGADVPPSLIEDAATRWGCPAMRVYGSTEYPTLTGASPDAPLVKRATTDGHVIAAAEVRLVDEQGEPVAAGQVGEILVRGPEMMVGYLSVAPEQTFTADGWFSTGDLGVMDADGYLEIKGRTKDIILRGGENIGVKEVEDLLITHPMIDEVAVVAYPDPAMTERACAVVVTGHAGLALADLVTFLRAQGLATQKFPERLERVDALPKTASGKVQKFKLRQDVAARVAAELPTA